MADAPVMESTWRHGSGAGFKPCPIHQNLPVFSQSVSTDHPGDHCDHCDHPQSFRRAKAVVGPFAYTPAPRGRSPSRLSDASTEDMCGDKAFTALTRSSSEPSLARTSHIIAGTHTAVVCHECMVTPRRSQLAMLAQPACQDNSRQDTAHVQADQDVSPVPSETVAEPHCKREVFTSRNFGGQPNQQPSISAKVKQVSDSQSSKHSRHTGTRQAFQQPRQPMQPQPKQPLSWIHVPRTPLWQRSCSSHSSPELAKKSAKPLKPKPEASMASPSSTKAYASYASNFTRAKQNALTAAKGAAKGALRHVLTPFRPLTPFAPSLAAKPKPAPAPKPKSKLHCAVASATSEVRGCSGRGAVRQSLKDENAALQADMSSVEAFSNFP